MILRDYLTGFKVERQEGNPPLSIISSDRAIGSETFFIRYLGEVENIIGQNLEKNH